MAVGRRVDSEQLVGFGALDELALNLLLLLFDVADHGEIIELGLVFWEKGLGAGRACLHSHVLSLV